MVTLLAGNLTRFSGTSISGIAPGPRHFENYKVRVDPSLLLLFSQLHLSFPIPSPLLAPLLFQRPSSPLSPPTRTRRLPGLALPRGLRRHRRNSPQLVG